MTDQLVYTDGLRRPVGRDTAGWDVTSPVPFATSVRVCRVMAQSGLFSPVIVAASVQRAWLAEQRAAGSTVPGAGDAFVAAVQEVIRDAPAL